MNTEVSEIESEVPESPPEPVEDSVEKAEPPPPRRSGSLLSFLAILISLAALAGAAWMWWQDRSASGQEQQVLAEISRLQSSDSELSLKLNQVREEMKALDADDVGADLGALQQGLAADRAKLSSVEQALSEQIRLSRSLQAAAESMQSRLLAAETALGGVAARELDARDQLDIAEVDYLLRLASERLQLFSDPDAADKALEVADVHLAALDNPMYLGVRQEISAARRELSGLVMPDYLQMTSQLDSMQQQIPALMFQGEAAANGVQGAAVDGESWWQKVKSVFSGLVTVRRSTDGENERISLQDKDFIRQRLWLQLEIAHLALMRRDQDAFRTALARARATLSAWFDQESENQVEFSRGLDQLAALDIAVDVPDITAPWATLNLLRKSRPAAPPAPEPASPDEEPPEDDRE